MAYSVTLYKNSGYNVINTPDTPARLAADAETETLPAINILQNRRLSQVLVACENADAEQADYIKIGNMYYAITDFKMQSVSTCLFEVVEKPLLSVGGVSKSGSGATANFDILDGVTSRCTVKDDSWGAYTAEDPLTAPQEPLQLQTKWLIPSVEGNIPSTISGDPICLESNVSLPKQAAMESGITYTDSETGETVTVPAVAPLITDIEEAGGLYANLETTNFTIDGATKSNGTAVYITNDSAIAPDSPNETKTAASTISEGLQAIRGLGAEQGSILNQWRLPREFVGSITETIGGITTNPGEGTSTTRTSQKVINITGVSNTMSSTISPDYTSVKNKRVLYGDYNKYGLITCAGNSAEFKPEDLGGETAPSISYKSDPRPKGKPYYRFTTINSDTDFWRNSLAGSEWENVPLVYQGASGSALTRLNFDNERAMKSLQADQYKENYKFTLFNNVIQGAKNIVTAGAEGAAVGGMPGAISGAVGAGIISGISMAQTMVSYDQYFEQYNQEKANELSGLYQSTTIYAPTVNFPYNADILRDVKGNGVLVYKYHMSPNDTKRVDKLLTMYGYMSAEPLTLENFQRRQKFDYVACSNVTVTGNYPKWLLDDIANELKNGIRIWHTKPNSAAYDDNPVRS